MEDGYSDASRRDAESRGWFGGGQWTDELSLVAICSWKPVGAEGDLMSSIPLGYLTIKCAAE